MNYIELTRGIKLATKFGTPRKNVGDPIKCMYILIYIHNHGLSRFMSVIHSCFSVHLYMRVLVAQFWRYRSETLQKGIFTLKRSKSSSME